jgi:hypothetical protein
VTVSTRLRLTAALVGTAVLAVTGCSSNPSAAASPSQAPPSSAAPNVGAAAPVDPDAEPFGATSVWKTSVAAAPVASNSIALVSTLAGEVASEYGGVAAFNVYDYNVGYYVVPADATSVNVIYDNCQNKTGTPAGLLGVGGQFTDVPVPSDAIPAGGTDAELTIYSPSRDQLWELWKAKHDAQGWHACWGGRIDHVSTSPGYFSGAFGASASGLAVAGGMITIDDAKRGSIDHALALAVTAPAKGIVSWPAQRTDGSDPSPSAIPEGTRLRLDPKIDVAALGLSPLATMIAKAAQTYGFIVTDTAGAVSVVTESGNAQLAATGTNPWAAFMGKIPAYEIMKNFPWVGLQALPKNYGKPAS